MQGPGRRQPKSDLCTCAGEGATTLENVFKSQHTLEAAMMAAPSRLGLESRKAGSDRAALENGGFEDKESI